MKTLSFLVAGLFGFLLVAASTTTAEARDYPVCIRGQYAFFGGGDGLQCDYDTFQQCWATASGTGGGCVVNPLYPYPAQGPIAPVRKLRRHAGHEY